MISVFVVIWKVFFIKYYCNYQPILAMFIFLMYLISSECACVQWGGMAMLHAAELNILSIVQELLDHNASIHATNPVRLLDIFD